MGRNIRKLVDAADGKMDMPAAADNKFADVDRQWTQNFKVRASLLMDITDASAPFSETGG
jgi:hypothetical protein